jgi:hypothetical protein
MRISWVANRPPVDILVDMKRDGDVDRLAINRN